MDNEAYNQIIKQYRDRLAVQNAPKALFENIRAGQIKVNYGGTPLLLEDIAALFQVPVDLVKGMDIPSNATETEKKAVVMGTIRAYVASTTLVVELAGRKLTLAHFITSLNLHPDYWVGLVDDLTEPNTNRVNARKLYNHLKTLIGDAEFTKLCIQQNLPYNV